jgi:hypothetical protein
MITIADKIFILKALKGDAKFFIHRQNIDTILEMRERLGKDKLNEIITTLRSV